MKEILKRDWPYAILIVVLVVLSVLSVGLLRFGFFTPRMPGALPRSSPAPWARSLPAAGFSVGPPGGVLSMENLEEMGGIQEGIPCPDRFIGETARIIQRRYGT